MATPLSALGATLDTSTPADPELRIKWSAINTVLNWTTALTAETVDLDPWVTSILVRQFSQNEYTKPDTLKRLFLLF
jgi:hypothetical protein